MSRKNRTRSRNDRTRDDHSIARGTRRFDPEFSDLSVRYDPRLVEDGRLWSPYERSARWYDGTATRTRVVPDRRTPVPYGRSSTFRAYDAPSTLIGFDESKPVTLCERRRARRESMFARKKAGRGGQRKPIWKPDSYVHCKRRK